MIWHIVKKEFLLNIISARFVVSLILCLLIIPFTTVINIDDYRNQVRLYHIDKQKAEDELKQTRVYSGLRPEIIRPPNPLSIICKGIDRNMGNKVKVYFGDIPSLPEGKASLRDNPFLNSFFSIDFIGVLSILLSVLALIFSYDLFTREKEDGTMKLALSNGISRSSLFLGKILGVLLTLLPILIVSYLLCLLIILFSKDISFSSDNWTNLILIFIFSILYIASFILTGAFISSRSKQSSTSIIVCLLCWIWFVFLVPVLASYSAESFVRVLSSDNLKYTVDELNDEFNRKVQNEIVPEVEKELNWSGQKGFWWYSSSYDGYQEISGTAKEIVEVERRTVALSEPLRIDYADKKWSIIKQNLDGFIRQNRFQNVIYSFSPSGLFEMVAEGLCRTDEKAFIAFMDDIREYRETLIEHFVQNNLFESYRYITAQPVDQILPMEETRRIANSGNIPDSWSSNKNPALDLTGVPMYQYEQANIRNLVRVSLIKMLILVSACAVLIILTQWSFNRYDVR
jgi:ABC-type transport system involved in multi-copper enzyme maturation permease subunit